VRSGEGAVRAAAGHMYASGVKTSRLRNTALPLTKFEYQRFCPRAADGHGDLEHELIAEA
jgi:hypothetical protein